MSYTKKINVKRCIINTLKIALSAIVAVEIAEFFKLDSFISAGNSDAAEKLRKLKILLDEKIISQADFDTKKQEILSKM